VKDREEMAFVSYVMNWSFQWANDHQGNHRPYPIMFDETFWESSMPNSLSLSLSLSLRALQVLQKTTVASYILLHNKVKGVEELLFSTHCSLILDFHSEFFFCYKTFFYVFFVIDTLLSHFSMFFLLHLINIPI